MDEMQMNFVPTLTLGDVETVPAVQPQAEEEPAVQSESPAAALEKEMAKLSPEEQKIISDFADQIDITDTNAVLQYGAVAQKHISDFSDSTLQSVRGKDMGEVGDMLSGLVAQLKDFGGEDAPRTKFGLRRRIAGMKAGYDKVEKTIDGIVETLQGHQITLLKDVSMLDKMYIMNQNYFKELTMYILAGKKKLLRCREEVLPALQQKAAETGLPEDAQAANDYANMLGRFDKKLYDLQLTRLVCIQMAPQIRLLQNNDSLMVEKIQSSIVNTIPLWKSQMVLSLGLAHSHQAMKAQQDVTNLTNDLLRKNAEQLKMGTVEVARESERGIVDLETLQQTNRSLIETLEEVRTVQEEGYQKRRAAEAELSRIEDELKQKLLEFRR